MIFAIGNRLIKHSKLSYMGVETSKIVFYYKYMRTCKYTDTVQTCRQKGEPGKTQGNPNYLVRLGTCYYTIELVQQYSLVNSIGFVTVQVNN